MDGTNGKPTLPTISISTRPHAPPVIRALLGKRVLYEDAGDPSAKRFRRQFVADLAGVMGAKPGDLKLLDPAILDAARQALDDRPQMPTPVTLGELRKKHPHLRESVIHGIARRGETININADPKIGKSWLAYGLLVDFVTSGDWLGRFACGGGRGLLVDYELHEETIAYRLPKVAEAKGVSYEKIESEIRIQSLRGHNADLHAICRWLDTIPAGEFDLVILDAWYRTLPPGVSENDNAQVMALYNAIDHTAGRLGCAWVNIHHTSKGSQSEKRVTDVGSGAGSQSRAADSHVAIREHEDAGCYVLEAAVRSWAPVEPLGLRWEFPLWIPDSGLDTGRLKGRKPKHEERQSARDTEGMDAILATLASGAATTREIRRKTSTAGGSMGKSRCERLLDMLEGEGRIEAEEVVVYGNKCRQYRLA